MLKASAIVWNSRVCVNTSVVLQRLVSTESKKVNQCPYDTSACDASNVKPYEAIPGPKPAPILGYLWHMLPLVGKYHGQKVHDVHIRYQKEYGDIVRLRDLKFAKDMVLCYDPKDIETIFRNEGPHPRRDILPSIKYYRENIRTDLFQGYGGVFTSDGETWQEARSVMNKMLMQPRVVKHYFKGFSEVSDDFVERIRYLSTLNDKQEMPDDFNIELMKWGLESVGYLSLDTRFGLFESNTKVDEEKLQYIQYVADFFDILYRIDVLPSLAKHMSTPTWKRYLKIMDGITEFIGKYVDLTIRRLEKEGYQNKSGNDMSVLEKLLKDYDRKYVFGNVLDILLGGVDTTAKTMGSFLYLLASNPDKQEILRQEINKILPKHDDVLTLEKLERMPYLRAVIKECMRIYPITLGVGRATSKDLVLSGYHVPKGTQVVVEQFPILRMEKYFPEPLKFKPERWLRSERKESNINPWLMFSFGFGPRSCVGRRIAQSELEILLPKIIKNYKMEWHHGEPEFDISLLLGITTPLNIRMIPIDQ